MEWSGKGKLRRGEMKVTIESVGGEGELGLGNW